MPALQIRPEEIGRYDPDAYRERYNRLRPAPQKRPVPVVRCEAPIDPPKPEQKPVQPAPVCVPDVPPSPIVAERRITFREIRDEELAKAGITLTQFEGDCRHRENVLARRIIWTRAATETGLSISAIGRLSGNKDHTSVLRAIIRHREETTGMIDKSMQAYREASRRRWHEKQAKKRAAALVEG
jgi:hypothetical protein